MLKRGDIISIEAGDHVYYPTNRHLKIPHNSHLIGKYRVYHTSIEGGGMNFDGPYPNGHRVFCENLDKNEILNFYQSGCFTAMMPDKKPIDNLQL